MGAGEFPHPLVIYSYFELMLPVGIPYGSLRGMRISNVCDAAFCLIRAHNLFDLRLPVHCLVCVTARCQKKRICDLKPGPLPPAEPLTAVVMIPSVAQLEDY